MPSRKACEVHGEARFGDQGAGAASADWSPRRQPATGISTGGPPITRPAASRTRSRRIAGGVL